MPNIKSAKKRVIVTDKKTLANKMFVTSMTTMIKKYEKAINDKDTALAQKTYKDAVKKLDQAVCKGHLHKNAAARKKSQFTKMLNSMGA